MDFILFVILTLLIQPLCSFFFIYNAKEFFAIAQCMEETTVGKKTMSWTLWVLCDAGREKIIMHIIVRILMMTIIVFNGQSHNFFIAHSLHACACIL